MSDYSPERIAYMEMVQGVINRLASTSATFKGFSVTLFAGVLAVIFSIGGNNRIPALIFACSANLIIAGFDCWYFYMEKRYRKKYNLIRLEQCPVDFDMKNDRTIKVSLKEVFRSKAIWLYYCLTTFGYIVSIVFLAQPF